MQQIDTIQKIGIGTTNPSKVQSVKDFFDKALIQDLLYESYKVPSGVSDQPLTVQETVEGAYNRCKECFKENSGLDLAVGLEGGVHYEHNPYGKYSDEICSLIGIVGIMDRKGHFHYDIGGRLILPKDIGDALKNGAELGPLMDALRNEANTKRKGGAIGYFTGGHFTRGERDKYNVATAFVPWLHPNHFTHKDE